jgi:hypothetical protein
MTPEEWQKEQVSQGKLRPAEAAREAKRLQANWGRAAAIQQLAGMQ